MNANAHKIRCWLCDLKNAWRNLRHAKVAKWTLAVHIVYYGHAATDAHGWHIVTAVACAVFLALELFSHDR